MELSINIAILLDKTVQSRVLTTCDKHVITHIATPQPHERNLPSKPANFEQSGKHDLIDIGYGCHQ